MECMQFISRGRRLIGRRHILEILSDRRWTGLPKKQMMVAAEINDRAQIKCGVSPLPDYCDRAMIDFPA